MTELLMETAAALRIAAVDRRVWSNTLGRGLIPPGEWPPPYENGLSRQFSVDDVIALTVFGMLLDLGAIPSNAGPLAATFRAVLAASPKCRSIGFVKTGGSVTPIADPPAGGDVLIPVSVQKLRVAIRRLHAELCAAP